MDKTDFWSRVDTVNAGMLDLDGSGRPVPMSHHADREANTFWFLTDAGTQIAEGVESGAKPAGYMLADNAKGLFATVSGTLSRSHDRAKLEALWNPITSTFFEGGIDDPDLRLLSFVVSGAEVWLAPTSGVVFMFNIAKAKVTGELPDMGDHFTI